MNCVRIILNPFLFHTIVPFCSAYCPPYYSNSLSVSITVSCLHILALLSSGNCLVLYFIRF